jgi:hypothetical protein
MVNEAYTSGHLASQLGMRDLIAHREQVITCGIELHSIIPYHISDWSCFKIEFAYNVP